MRRHSEHRAFAGKAAVLDDKARLDRQYPVAGQPAAQIRPAASTLTFGVAAWGRRRRP